MKLYVMYPFAEGYDFDTNEMCCEDIFSTVEEEFTVSKENLVSDDDFIYDTENEENIYPNYSNTNFFAEKNWHISVGDHYFNTMGVDQWFREGIEEKVAGNDTDFGGIIGTKSGLINYIKVYWEDIFLNDLEEDEAMKVRDEIINYIEKFPTEFPE